MATKPYLLYAYPWMPYPRRIIIYLRERKIPSTLVTIVPVSDPHLPTGNTVSPSFPPRPQGSLPILAIPSSSTSTSTDTPVTYTYIRQSVAIMHYLDTLCDTASNGFPLSKYPMRGIDALSQARETELLTLAEELLVAWNPVRMFGTGAGTMPYPEGAKEMLRWVYRDLYTVESWFQDRRSFDHLERGGRGPSVAEIVLYQFFEFTRVCYGVDLLGRVEGEMVVDVYGREVVMRFDRLKEFVRVFGGRESAVLEEDEKPSKEVLANMSRWEDGVL
ncbi:hypothetical protein BKA65DRAFT_594778 [Rhexocercosporidium sp. MPI-PUGE-AT-0058]|nr:hypothetical protein BKA65DRAFT_594778 [Rhexocercosporidium sp. MPI-PUGE-AT-0058]